MKEKNPSMNKKLKTQGEIPVSMVAATLKHLTEQNNYPVRNLSQLVATIFAEYCNEHMLELLDDVESLKYLIERKYLNPSSHRNKNLSSISQNAKNISAILTSSLSEE